MEEAVRLIIGDTPLWLVVGGVITAILVAILAGNKLGNDTNTLGH